MDRNPLWKVFLNIFRLVNPENHLKFSPQFLTCFFFCVKLSSGAVVKTDSQRAVICVARFSWLNAKNEIKTSQIFCLLSIFTILHWITRISVAFWKIFSPMFFCHVRTTFCQFNWVKGWDNRTWPDLKFSRRIHVTNRDGCLGGWMNPRFCCRNQVLKKMLSRVSFSFGCAQWCVASIFYRKTAFQSHNATCLPNTRWGWVVKIWPHQAHFPHTKCVPSSAHFVWTTTARPGHKSPIDRKPEVPKVDEAQLSLQCHSRHFWKKITMKRFYTILFWWT